MSLSLWNRSCNVTIYCCLTMKFMRRIVASLKTMEAQMGNGVILIYIIYWPQEKIRKKNNSC